ncbi:MAG TPA: hypothetical protein VFM54_15760 [Micromonosporaceae bacterium]|nr:hypothetical protein [Micromonosporaceae bacterium]
MEYPDWGSSRRGRRGWAPAGTWSAVDPARDDPADEFHGGDWLRPADPGGFGHPPAEPGYGQPWVTPRQPREADPRHDPRDRDPRDRDPRDRDPRDYDAGDEMGRPDAPSGRGRFDPTETTDAPVDPRDPWYAGPVVEDGDWYEDAPWSPATAGHGGAGPPRTGWPPGPPRSGRDRPEQPHPVHDRPVHDRPGRAPAARPGMDAEDEPDGRGYVAVLMMTAAWYLAPIAFYLLWALTLGSTRDVSCVGASGEPCPAPRAEALSTLVDNAPQLGTALALSLALALALRWMTSAWRMVTIGFAAAVVGAGLTTVVFSLFY